MHAYKFETTILDNGIIQLPEISKYANQQIEIFIVIKQIDQQVHTKAKQPVDQFLNKWTGFLKGCDPDESKFQYLSRKYK
ncbi:hypothetical protein MHK_005668 [Candidatus Magnetomorum sp. HK-1]|nr:hypothetical protein MHK_005668 [Candidatus Magnetomorum sp. HK-1]